MKKFLVLILVVASILLCGCSIDLTKVGDLLRGTEKAEEVTYERKHYADSVYVQWRGIDEIEDGGIDTAYTKGKYLYIGIEYVFGKEFVVGNSGIFGTADVDGYDCVVNVLTKSQNKFSAGSLSGKTYLLFKINIKKLNDNEPQSIKININGENRDLMINFRLDW